MRYFIYAFLLLTFFACKQKSSLPDVSNINVKLNINHFENDLFKADTTKLNETSTKLFHQYPNFYPFFIQQILGIENADTTNNFQPEKLKIFVTLTHSLFDTLQKQNMNFEKVNQSLTTSCKYLKYYFPKYDIPKNIIFYLGPLDAISVLPNGEQSTCILRPDFLCVGLQYYLGSNFSLYQNEFFVSNIAPRYISRRFNKDFLVKDIMKFLIDDAYPIDSRGQSLIEQMIAKGKIWYLLQNMMPNTSDTIITGYTKEQIEFCKKYEGLIWSQVLKTTDIYSKELSDIQNYIGEAPTTQNFPPETPGNLGQWIGWQIVKKYATEKNQNLLSVLKTPAINIFNDSKYKPK